MSQDRAGFFAQDRVGFFAAGMAKVAAELSSKLDAALAQGDHALVADLENRLEAVKDYQRQIAAAVREQDYGRAAELKKKLALAAERPSSPIKPQKAPEHPTARALQADLDRVSQEMSLASVRSGVEACISVEVAVAGSSAEATFDDLGLTSMQAIRLSDVLSDRFDVEVAAADFIDHPTITLLSKYIYELVVDEQ